MPVAKIVSNSEGSVGWSQAAWASPLRQPTSTGRHHYCLVQAETGDRIDADRSEGETPVSQARFLNS